MKKHLFYTFLIIFVITTIVVILGITQLIQIKDEYLKPLCYVFLVEVAGAVIAIFKRADFFDEQEKTKTPKIKEIPKNRDDDGLSEEEKEILRLFAKIDDSSLTISQIAKRSQKTKLRAKNAIEKLQRKGFVLTNSIPYSFKPTEYKLNMLGREYIVKHGLDDKQLDKTEERILKYIHGSQEVDIGEFAGYMPEIPDDELNFYIEELVKGRYIKKSKKFSRIWLDDKGKQYLINNKLIDS